MKIAFYALNQNFCGSILEELRAHHNLKVYRPTRDQSINWVNMMKLMDWCDLAYFDFIQDPLPQISQLQIVDKPIVTRMDGIDILNHMQVDWRKVDALVLMPVQEKRLNRLRSNWLRDHPRKKLAPLPKRILKRNIGIDMKLFTPDYQREPGYRIGFHAYVVRNTKRVYLALQNFFELVKRDPEKPWQLHLIGGGWDPGSYQWNQRFEYVMSLLEYLEDIDPHIGSRLMISPNFPRPQWALEAKKVDVMWSTSYREGFPNSIGEAAACGAWPLMNRFYGAETIYPEENICWTPSEMVEKTISWGSLSDEEKKEKRLDIRAWISQYDRHTVAREIRELCEEVFRDRR